MDEILQLAAHGLHSPDAGLALIRGATGTFFALSGYNKLTNAARHATIAATMQADKVPFPRVMSWWVPSWELIAGTSLTIGFLSSLSAMILAIILLVACCCEGRQRVAAYAPINAADRADDWLYLPEVTYLLALAVTLLCGHGKFALDTLFF